MTRSEHENLYGQVEEVLRMLRRIENQLQTHGDRLNQLELDIEQTLGRFSKGA